MQQPEKDLERASKLRVGLGSDAPFNSRVTHARVTYRYISREKNQRKTNENGDDLQPIDKLTSDKVYMQVCTTGKIWQVFLDKFVNSCAMTIRIQMNVVSMKEENVEGGGGYTPYNGLYREAPSERGT